MPRHSSSVYQLWIRGLGTELTSTAGQMRTYLSRLGYDLPILGPADDGHPMSLRIWRKDGYGTYGDFAQIAEMLDTPILNYELEKPSNLVAGDKVATSPLTYNSVEAIYVPEDYPNHVKNNYRQVRLERDGVVHLIHNCRLLRGWEAVSCDLHPSSYWELLEDYQGEICTRCEKRIKRYIPQTPHRILFKNSLVTLETLPGLVRKVAQ